MTLFIARIGFSHLRREPSLQKSRVILTSAQAVGGTLTVRSTSAVDKNVTAANAVPSSSITLSLVVGSSSGFRRTRDDKHVGHEKRVTCSSPGSPKHVLAVFISKNMGTSFDTYPYLGSRGRHEGLFQQLTHQDVAPASRAACGAGISYPADCGSCRGTRCGA